MDHFGKSKIKVDTFDTILSELYEHVKNYSTLRKNSKGSQEWLPKIDLKGFQTELQKLTSKTGPKRATYARKDGMSTLLKEINGLTIMQHCVKEGLVEFVDILLGEGVNPNIVNPPDSKPSVLLAAESGHFDMLQKFMDLSLIHI